MDINRDPIVPKTGPEGGLEPLLLPPPEGVAPGTPKFCGQCGAPWDPDAAACSQCDGKRTAPGSLSADRVRDAGSLKPAFTLYFTLLGVSMVGIVAAIAGAEPLAIEFAVTLVDAVIVLAWCLGSQRKAVLPMLRWASPAYLAAGAALSPLTMAIGLVCVDGLHQAFDVPVERYSPPFLEAGFGWGMVVLVVAVFPAVFEELAFRGVVLQAIQPLLSPGEAVLVSSLMFMILHLSVASFPHTFVLGMAAGWLCLRSRSILPGMLLHFLHNFICVGMEWAGIQF